MVCVLARLLLFATVVLASFTAAHAQSDWPRQPIKMVVGLAPGSINDLQTRTIAAKLSERLGQPVIVENRPGAGGNIAAELVARAAPDGYTILNAPTATLAINPAVYRKLSYDPLRDFAPITQVSAYPLYLTVSAALPVNSVKELLAYAKAHPDKANLSSSSTFFELVTALFTRDTGVSFVNVPFKSTPETLNAVLTGQTMITLVELNTLAPQLKSGKARALAATTGSRTADLPDVPSMAEAGFPHAVAQPFTGFVMPKGTPPAIVERLSSEMNAILKLPDVIARWKSFGLNPVESNPAVFAKFIKDEIARWSAVAKAANIRLD